MRRIGRFPLTEKEGRAILFSARFPSSNQSIFLFQEAATRKMLVISKVRIFWGRVLCGNRIGHISFCVTLRVANSYPCGSLACFANGERELSFRANDTA